MAAVDLRHGDCLDGLRAQPDDTFDLVVTSPPFNLGGKFHTSWRDGTMRQYGDYGECKDNMPEDEYQDWQVAVLAELYRTLKLTGSLYYQHKVRIKSGVAIHPLEWLRRSQFHLKQEIVIAFPGTVNMDKVRYYPTCERLYWMTKEAGVKLVDPRAAAFKDIWDIPHIKSRQGQGHPAAFDEELPRRCIQASSLPDDLVCDPFFGSGTVPVVAAGMGRRFIGWELDARYVTKAQRRLQRVQSVLIT